MKALQVRIADRSVLRLIRMWLCAPIVDKDENGQPKVTRPRQGTPQGGVISPLLANIFLHWFERAFHAPDGPYHWAHARLVRYADDFVILTRYQGRHLAGRGRCHGRSASFFVASWGKIEIFEKEQGLT